ncbi:MAG TPA: histidine phosphatase family protein [Chitinophagaceae bacterium]|mgnify:CR=1 FL=1|nr:histidine phosphatase family protein [Chitinophagaceae bacterium]HPH30314.1 histidine phosphatase family protein [Chitinophagaceae bacterium]HPN59639.1 histidine phosphatase family protein [Chitinophagaceae bacterium]
MKYLLLIALFSLGACGNTIYIVRHAEKEPVPAGSSQMMANNPPLSEAGKERSFALRDRLRHERIRFIFSTNTTRTVSTAQPLNELLGTTRIELYSSKKDSTDFFISQLKSIKKGNILVVGHSNTIDDIANKLCGKTVVPGDLDEKEYSNLFVVKRKGGRYVFKRKRYGN